MPLETVSFFTSDYLVQWVDEDDSAGSLLSDLEERVVGRIIEETGRWLGKEKELKWLVAQPGDTDSIYLPDLLVSITSLKIGATRDIANMAVLVASEYGFDENEVYRTNGASFPVGWAEVTYRAGYVDSSKDAPFGIRQAVLDIVAFSWRNRVTTGSAVDAAEAVVIRVPRKTEDAIRRARFVVGL